MVTQIPQISQIYSYFMLFRGFWIICGISEICVTQKTYLSLMVTQIPQISQISSFFMLFPGLLDYLWDQ